jgi:hypothetical protein
MRFLESATRTRLCSRMRRNLVSEKRSSRFRSFAARSCLNEISHRAENVLRRFEKSAVNSDFVRGKADDYCPVLRQPNAVMRVESQAEENTTQIIC